MSRDRRSPGPSSPISPSIQQPNRRLFKNQPNVLASLRTFRNLTVFVAPGVMLHMNEIVDCDFSFLISNLEIRSEIEIILITASPPVITFSHDFDWKLRLY